MRQLQEEQHYYALEKEELLKLLQVSEKGLSSSQAAERKKRYGENKLPDKKAISLFSIIMHQVLNPLIFILVAAAIASILIGEGKDAIFIFLVILINTALGTYQEYQAEKSASSLQQLMRILAKLRRDGKELELDSKELVPGDRVYLETGMKVPADMRLFELNGLEVDESFLTGESVAVVKELDSLEKPLSLGDRKNMAFAGSTVVSGRAWGIVCATALDTQVGQIAQSVSEGESAKPPLVLRMEKFVARISIAILLLSVGLALVLRYQGMDFEAIFFFVVALAVSAIPEGLPVALTVAYSLASKRMANRSVIVRKLSSVESLGSCTVIASDKTGTLTVNEQTVKQIHLLGHAPIQVSGAGYTGEGELRDTQGQRVEARSNRQLEELLHIAVLANEGELLQEQGQWLSQGDAMDRALLAMAYKAGIEPESLRKSYPLEGLVPYEPERKYSAAFYRFEGQLYALAKGAVETVLELCSESIAGPLDKKKLLAQANTLAQKGYRVLGFARGMADESQNKGSETKLQKLCFYGLIAFLDPLRPDAKDAISICQGAGIRVLMITGDHPATAHTIACDLGISSKEAKAVTGAMLSEAGSSRDADFRKLVASTNVFARVSPKQKLEITEALIEQGEFVAVTGDGVNDAPALKRANIGVAMGSGTDVAKEVGDMIIIDDAFSSIVAGVEEGRYAYDNVRKVIYLLISTGMAEVLLFLASIFMGLPLPLLAVQLLWLNLVTNGIQDVALAFEGGEPGALKRPARKTSEGIFDSLMLQQSLVSSLTMGGIVFGLWYWLSAGIELSEEQVLHNRNLILLLMVCMQNVHALNCRSETTSAFLVPFSRNWVLIFGILAAQGIHILSMQLPFMRNILQMDTVRFDEWLYIMALALPMLFSLELFKFVRARLAARG